MGTRVLSSELKQPRHEAGHSPPSSAKVTSSPPYIFMAWYLVKYRDDFAFSFTCIYHIVIMKYNFFALFI
jgi:hypothetical protein